MHVFRLSVMLVALLAAASPVQAQLRTQVEVSGLSGLVNYVPDPLNAGVFYGVQQNGIVRVVQNGVVLPTPFLDLTGQLSTGGERGLLGLVFSPDASSGRVFVNFTNPAGHTVIARFRRSSAGALTVDPSSRFDLRWPDGNRFITQPYSNHNGGHLAFGPDGYLYIGLGDGGSGNDPENRAQDPNTLLGKMLRIDINVSDADGTGYRVPPDNPFLDGVPIPALGEIWSFGWRNPWRYSFDDTRLGGTGALFVGDVGQSAREEISYEPPATGGRNYGWRMREGTIATPGVPTTTPAFTPLIDPLLDYPRTTGTTVTGGYVYRGRALGANYVGRYFFADFGSGRVFSIAWTPSAATSSGAAVTSIVDHSAELGTISGITSFSQDAAGELYLVLISGRVLKLVPDAPRPTAPANLTAQVSGSSVTLRWTGSTGATQYRIEAGSQPGLSNLGVFDISAQTSVTVTNVPNGTYYVRIRAIANGAVSDPSNEVIVIVGGSCTGPPPPLTNLAFMRNNRLVSLTWTPQTGLLSILLEVGTASGLANLAVFTLPGDAPGIAAQAGPGTYYVRVKGVNACGTSSASNEVVIIVP